MKSKVLEAQILRDVIVELRAKNPKPSVVLCHGVFDLVHPGHLEHFCRAKNFGEILIVSITSDRFINKGPGRPFFSQARRAEFLAALEVVDYVHVVDAETALEAIDIVRPDYYVKGPDYSDLSSDITGMISIEKQAVESHGGKVVFTDGFTSSSTKLINNELFSQTSEVRKWARDFNEKISQNVINEFINKMKLTQVNVLGETIIDIYTNCLPLAKSSKDPILAFQKFDSQQFLGGVLAIADVASQLAESTRVLSVAGKEIEDYVAELNPNRAYILEMLELETQPTIKKHRFVDSKSGYRVFEYYDFDSSEIALVLQDQIIERLSRKINSQSLVIAADYGHGFFAQRMIDKLCALDVFLAVNTQANAGNRGFNTYNKYPRIDFLSLNGNELELALRKKNLDYSEVIPNIMREKACSYAVVTLGGDGLLTFDATGEYAHTPAFASKVVDKVGAGDSVLAIASILGFLNAPKELIGLLSSVVAAFEVEQLGHKSSLDVVSMKKYVKGLLG